MIPRYSRPDMVAIWTPEARFRIWFEIEAHACDAQAELGVIPKAAAKAVWERGKWEIERIDAIERETKHDVIAFLTNLAEYAFGREPQTSDAGPLSEVGTVEESGQRYLTLTFSRARNAFDLTIQPQFSSNLVNWSTSSIQVGPAVDLGDGREQLIYRDTVPLTPGASRFGRIRIETP